MTLVELLELAPVVAAHAPLLIRAGRAIQAEALRQYWSVCKCRQQRWAQSLKQLLSTVDEGPDAGQTNSRIRPVLEEILATEILTRVSTAVLTAHDRRRQTADAEPIARSVLAGHLEARHRTLTLLVGRSAVPPQDAIDLNRLRRHAERWNDMLIGSLLTHDDVAEFAFDAALAREFADDFRAQSAWQPNGAAWPMVGVSLKAGLRGSLGHVSLDGHRHNDGNDQLAAAILGCFGPELFDSVGLPQSLWNVRLLHMADSTQVMIAELFAAEKGVRHQATGVSRD